MSKEKETSRELEMDQELESRAAEQDVPAVEADSELPELIELKKEEFIQIKEHISGLEKERDEMKGLAQRVQADFNNFRLSNATVMTDCREEGVRSVIFGLLPVLDNFDRALENAEGVDENYVSGVALVHRQLMDTLAKCGLKEVPADGMFDPNLHEAVMQEACEGVCSGSIAEVFQKGYQVNERIIRHSMVKVAQ